MSSLNLKHWDSMRFTDSVSYFTRRAFSWHPLFPAPQNVGVSRINPVKVSTYVYKSNKTACGSDWIMTVSNKTLCEDAVLCANRMKLERSAVSDLDDLIPRPSAGLQFWGTGNRFSHTYTLLPSSYSFSLRLKVQLKIQVMQLVNDFIQETRYQNSVSVKFSHKYNNRPYSI